MLRDLEESIHPKKTSPDPSPQTYYRVPALVADVKITGETATLDKEACDLVHRESGQWRQMAVAA